MPKDLHSFLSENGDLLIRIDKPVPRDHLSALIAEADRPILFENIE